MSEEKKTVGQKLAGLSGPLLTLWQLVKFIGVGGLGGIIQAVLQYIFPVFFDGLTATLPKWLDFLYNEPTLFDTDTAAGAADAAKYIIGGTVTWGYVLPFFLANIIANIFVYIMNKKYTFKSSAPRWHFVLYFVIMVLTIVFATWMQGALYPLIIRAPWEWMHSLASGCIRWQGSSCSSRAGSSRPSYSSSPRNCCSRRTPTWWRKHRQRQTPVPRRRSESPIQKRTAALFRGRLLLCLCGVTSGRGSC